MCWSQDLIRKISAFACGGGVKSKNRNVRLVGHFHQPPTSWITNLLGHGFLTECSTLAFAITGGALDRC